MNRCVTPEGEDGFCMNIWECSSHLKNVFSDIQNSVQTYNTLKAVCEYTNSTVKLCCASSIYDEKVRKNYSNQYKNINVIILKIME